MSDARRLGFIGLGNIGGGVAANLVADGHRVTVHDTDSAKAAAVKGADVAAGPAEVATAAEITFLSLPSPAVMDNVSRAWAEGARPGKVLVDLTTNSPATVRAVGARLGAQGLRFLESPVTGGAIGARNRMLVFIIGGDADVVAQVEPVLKTIGRATYHLGPLGCGSVGKLCNSLMAFTTQVVSYEGLALGDKYGIDLRELVEMVRFSGGAHSFLERRVEAMNDREGHADFSIDLAAKDAGLMLEAGRDVSLPMPVASAVHEVLVLAKAQGLGDRDINDLVEAMERVAGVQLRLGPPKEPDDAT
jgi:3-hydroxyisobutyrate dehydrogenase-like beta-hydroxyacid dehydrogenase